MSQSLPELMKEQISILKEIRDDSKQMNMLLATVLLKDGKNPQLTVNSSTNRSTGLEELFAKSNLAGSQ